MILERKNAMNMGTTILTPRKLEALVAAYFDQWPGEQFAYVKPDSTPQFTRHTNMGGATARMVEELRDLGYLTERDRSNPEDEPKTNALTVKGYDAIIEQLTGKEGTRKAQLAALIDPIELEQRRRTREQFEIMRDRRRAEAVRDAARRVAQRREERDAKTAAGAAGLLREFGLTGWETWDRPKLLDFVDRMASQ
jgi:hypothetical protein